MGQSSIVGQFLHIKEVDAVALGQVLAHDAGEPQDNKAVALQEFICTGENLWPLLLEPQHFRRSVGGQEAVPRHGEDPLPADITAHPLTDVPGPGVHPDGRRRQDTALLVHRDGGPALAVHTHAPDFRRVHGSLAQHIPQGVTGRSPPRLRVLLRPAGRRVADGIGPVRLGQHGPVLIKGRRFTGGRADINADKLLVHRSAPPQQQSETFRSARQKNPQPVSQGQLLPARRPGMTSAFCSSIPRDRRAVNLICAKSARNRHNTGSSRPEGLRSALVRRPSGNVRRTIIRQPRTTGFPVFWRRGLPHPSSAWSASGRRPYKRR